MSKSISIARLASPPKIIARTNETALAINPIVSEILLPYTILEKRSRPKLSAPIKNTGYCFPFESGSVPKR